MTDKQDSDSDWNPEKHKKAIKKHYKNAARSRLRAQRRTVTQEKQFCLTML